MKSTNEFIPHSVIGHPAHKGGCQSAQDEFCSFLPCCSIIVLAAVSGLIAVRRRAGKSAGTNDKPTKSYR